MTELERLFASAKQMTSPDLWPDIEHWERGQGVEGRAVAPRRVLSRVTSATVAVAAALAAFIFLWSAFRGQTQGAMDSPSVSQPPVPSFNKDSVRYLYPFFAQTSGWNVTDSGQVSSGDAAVAWASNVPFDPSDLGPRSPAIPPSTIAGLPPDGVVLVAETTPWSYDPTAGPWPFGSLDRLSLQDAVVRGPQAEEPQGNYSVYVIEGYVNIRAYFGSPSPSPQVVAEAQSELDTLQVPPTCPVPAKGSFPDTMDEAPTQGPVGTTVTMTALLPFQKESGSYDTSASTVIELWWDADPAAWEQLMASQPPPPGTLVAKGGEGSCFLSVSFTVPSNAAPGDHSIVALETNAGRTSGTLFGVSHFDVTP